jgi:subfamily B ATP-binding cassette protein MsbA
VLQDTALFHGTIAKNIAFGRPGASREDIVKAAELANAHEFISKMPQGCETMVGERGSTHSGGQRQRIGIARVMVRNNPILLLTAALDSKSETIAHGLTTIRDADQIIHQ